MKILFFVYFIIFVFAPAHFATAQELPSIASVINHLRVNSKLIDKDSNIQKIIKIGEPILYDLSNKFLDTATSKVYSDCHNRFLNNGEIAMIIADKIETIPALTVIGVQNCMLESCENNTNWVEYYFDFIEKQYYGMLNTKRNYDTWLVSQSRQNIKNNFRDN